MPWESRPTAISRTSRTLFSCKPIPGLACSSHYSQSHYPIITRPLLHRGPPYDPVFKRIFGQVRNQQQRRPKMGENGNERLLGLLQSSGTCGRYCTKGTLSQSPFLRTRGESGVMQQGTPVDHLCFIFLAARTRGHYQEHSGNAFRHISGTFHCFEMFNYAKSWLRHRRVSVLHVPVQGSAPLSEMRNFIFVTRAAIRRASSPPSLVTDPRVMYHSTVSPARYRPFLIRYVPAVPCRTIVAIFHSLHSRFLRSRAAIHRPWQQLPGRSPVCEFAEPATLPIPMLSVKGNVEVVTRRISYI